MGTYSVIVTCRNSEKYIKTSLTSIINQSLKPESITVIDDGSTDGTHAVLSEIQNQIKDFHVITLPDNGYDICRVVFHWNAALRLQRELGLRTTDYHMIAQDDSEFERDYAEKIVQKMDSDETLAMVSGNYDDNRYVTPHGTGRFVNNRFFKLLHEYYPEKMGYESLILHIALKFGFKFEVLNDAKFIHMRQLGSVHHFYDWGASMKTLGYHPIFVTYRFLKYFCTGKPIGRIGAISMFYHYIRFMPSESGYCALHDSEIRDEIRRTQLLKLRSVYYTVRHPFRHGITRKLTAPNVTKNLEVQS